MDLISAVFGVLIAVLVILSIILGLLLSKYRLMKRHDESKDESQLDRIERKSDTAFLYNLGLTGMVVGLTLLTTNLTLKGGWTLFFVGAGLSIAGIVRMFKGWKVTKH
ncbi:MAG: hypothetical protein ISS51_03505 [Dehalococcoidales bacterium]|nr:hypothetical protein [Dehalococcoidales bacterium]